MRMPLSPGNSLPGNGPLPKVSRRSGGKKFGSIVTHPAVNKGTGHGGTLRQSF